MFATHSTAAATSRERPAGWVDTNAHLASATISAHALAQEARVNVATSRVVSKAENTTSATSLVRLAARRNTMCHRTTTARSAVALRYIWCIRHSLSREQGLQALFPCGSTQALLVLIRQNLPVLIHEGELPAMLLANDVQPFSILSVPRVRNKPFNMGGKADLAMDLSLLVLHVANLVRITQQNGVATTCHLDGLLQLHIIVLAEDMCVEVQDGQTIRLEVCGVLGGKSATKPNIL